MPTPLPTTPPPAQVPAAFVDESSQEVLDMLFVVQSAVPVAPAGFRYLVHYNPGFSLPDDWAAGQAPVIGDLWEGNIPASFVKPPPIPDALAGLTAAQLIAKADELNMQSAAVNAALAANLSG